MNDTTISNYNRSVNIAMMPDRIRRLPISPTGYPVPWFVTWFKDGKPCETGEGVPDFRVVDPRKIRKALSSRLCWVCGAPRGIFQAFVIGPMCSITRTISEPPSHRECAIFSARQCPFLSKPNMVRNEKGLTDDDGQRKFKEPAGVGLTRNPGATCVWITKSFRPFNAEAGQPGVLFSIGQPVEVLWFANGHKASRAEVMASIDSGYPLLEDMARQEGGGALQALAAKRETAMALVPEQ